MAGKLENKVHEPFKWLANIRLKYELKMNSMRMQPPQIVHRIIEDIIVFMSSKIRWKYISIS